LNRIVTLFMAFALALGLVALPATAVVPEESRSVADAHQVTGTTKVKKLERLSGTVIRGHATSKITRVNGSEFDRNHIRKRKLNSYIAVSNTKRGEYKPVARSIVGEDWNKRYSSGPQRPTTKCQRGKWYRTIAVHTVDQRDVWVVGGVSWHGPYKVQQFEKAGPRMKC